MTIQRKTFLKTLGGLSLGLFVGPLAANDVLTNSNTVVLNPHEEKHLQRFYEQLKNADYHLPEKEIACFRPVRLVKRKHEMGDYHFEYIARNGNRIVMTSKKGEMSTFSYNNI